MADIAEGVMSGPLSPINPLTGKTVSIMAVDCMLAGRWTQTSVLQMVDISHVDGFLRTQSHGLLGFPDPLTPLPLKEMVFRRSRRLPAFGGLTNWGTFNASRWPLVCILTPRSNEARYWSMLSVGTDGCRHLSSSRWDTEAYFEADKDRHGTGS